MPITEGFHRRNVLEYRESSVFGVSLFGFWYPRQITDHLTRDMVLLSRIRQQQGREDEALRLSSKALAFRQELLGNGLKTCDSLYEVAAHLQLREDYDLAM